MSLVTDRLYRFLDTNGDGTGTKNANVDGSVTPVDFKITCPSGYWYALERMIVHVVDVGAFDVDQYGALAALTSGLTVKVYDDGDNELLDLLDGVPIKQHYGWGRMCYDATVNTFGGAGGTNQFVARWTFSKDDGKPIFLQPGWYFQMTVNDNLTGLVEHYFTIRGKRTRRS